MITSKTKGKNTLHVILLLSGIPYGGPCYLDGYILTWYVKEICSSNTWELSYEH